MRSLRAAIPLAIAASLVAVSPAAADAKAPSKAKASGAPTVELTYPSIVRARVARTERALERATRKIENGKVVEAATTLKVVRRQMSSAWRGAKYVVRTAPPPPPEEDLARAAGDPPTGPTYASPPETAFRVLTLQHDVASEVVQLIDGSHGTGLNALSTTLNFANDRRDGALAYILSVAPPVPPDDEEDPEDPEDPPEPLTRGQARASQDEDAAPTFDTVMPNMVAQLDDELQAITGTLADATDLTAGGRRLLNAANTQVTASRGFVNTNWPVLPPED
jgi:hypothetical protein